MFKVIDAHKFLSGDVITKMEQAQKALEVDSSFEKEVRVLSRILPLTVVIADIDITIGATWIPTKYYQQFCKEVFDVDASFYYSSISGNWEIDTRRHNSDANMTTYGYTYTYEVKGAPAAKTIPAVGTKIEDGLFSMAMHFKVPQISDKVFRREAALKQEQISRIWVDWCKDGERGLELEKIYNAKFNRLVLPNWDNTSPTRFREVLLQSGMSKDWVERLRPYQLDSIWRMAIGGNSLLGLEVGFGKTSVAIATVMLRKHYKTSHKAMFIVQKSTLVDFYDVFREMYPKVQVLCASPEDCSGINRQKFLAKAAFWNYDAIIVTHESFKAIPVRKATEQAFIEEKLVVIEADLQDLYDKGETSKRVGKKRGNRIVKRLEEMRDKLQAHLDIISTSHDVGIYFEDVNPSILVVDECQRFKNNYFSTKIQAKGLNLSPSQRSEDFELKLAYMRKTYPNNNFLLMVTGTPEPTNSLVGVYIFQSYLQPEELEKRGLAHFDAWAAAFGRVVSKIEPGLSGGLELSQRFAEFVNIPELLQMYLSCCHIKRFEDVAGQAGFTRPRHKVKAVKSPLSDFQSLKMDEIAQRRSYIVKDDPLHFPSYDKAGCLLDEDGKRLVHPDTNQPVTEIYEAIALGLKWGKKIDNHLWLVTDARKLMIAPQLVDPEQPIEPLDKVNLAVRRIYQWWRRTKQQKSTQLVFLDMGTPGGSSKFEIYKWMRQQLIDKGIPTEEIAFIHDYPKGQAKKQLFERVNAGEVRVLFGSTEPMGIGVNVQKKIKVVHFLDIPRRPDQYEQRLGRAVRSGNENDVVLIYQYLTQGQNGNFGADAAQMHLLETKLRSREQLLKADPTVRRIVEEDDQLLLFMMLSAHATGDIRFLRYMECKTELEVEQSRGNLVLREINQLNVGSGDTSLPVLKNAISYVEKQLELGARDVELAKSHLNDDFVCQVGKQVYDIRQDAKAIKLADAHIHEIIEKELEETKGILASSGKTFISSLPIVIGEYGGITIVCRVHVNEESEGVELWLKGEGNYDFKYRVSEQRLIRNMVGCYAEIATKDKYLQQRLVKLHEQIEDTLAQLGTKRQEREVINEKILKLKQEKAYLESALSIRVEDVD